jgi:branched-chain amino acid transport system ATP-binding protein
MLNIKTITAGYGAADVLHGVQMHVNQGEIVALLGANGAGKSTLLKIITGLLQPRKGSVWFEDYQINGQRPEDLLRKGIACVPERRRIFAGLTVLENLKMGAYIERRKEVIEENLKAVYERFPVLKERSHQQGETLSGGEQQQLAIARALMSQPKLLLLDEPSIGLAPNLVHSVMDLLCDLRDDGLTMLLVEQDIHDALEIADRGYVIASGNIEIEGTAEELKEKGLELEQTYLGEIS